MISPLELLHMSHEMRENYLISLLHKIKAHWNFDPETTTWEIRAESGEVIDQGQAITREIAIAGALGRLLCGKRQEQFVRVTLPTCKEDADIPEDLEPGKILWKKPS